MSKHKIIGLALCGLILTSCGNGGENTAAETELSEASAASESVLETTVSETETEMEISESSETITEETKSNENFDKVKDRIVYDDGESSLTAGQYINSLLECEEFRSALDLSGNSDTFSFQLVDLNDSGIPEILIWSRDGKCARFYSVSSAGKADIIPAVGDEASRDWDWIDVCDDNFVELGSGFFYSGNAINPYIKDGKQIWVGETWHAGSDASYSGTYILNYDGSVLNVEAVYYSTYVWNYGVDSGEPIKTSFGKADFLDEAEPANAVCVTKDNGNNSFSEILADMLKEYLEK